MQRFVNGSGRRRQQCLSVSMTFQVGGRSRLPVPCGLVLARQRTIRRCHRIMLRGSDVRDACTPQMNQAGGRFQPSASCPIGRGYGWQASSRESVSEPARRCSSSLHISRRSARSHPRRSGLVLWPCGATVRSGVASSRRKWPVRKVGARCQSQLAFVWTLRKSPTLL